MVAARRMVLAFALWTLFVWAGRVANVLRDDSLSAEGKVGRVALAASFAVPALVLVIWRATHWRARTVPPIAGLVTALAAWTVGVWIVRTVEIARHHHHATFVAVHAVLAVVSVVLAGLTVRALAAERHVEGEGEAAASTPGLEELVDG
jgi:hypothetical protein